MLKIGLARFIEDESVWNCYTTQDKIQMSFHTPPTDLKREHVHIELASARRSLLFDLISFTSF